MELIPTEVFPTIEKGLSPIAQRVGPFPGSLFLQAWWEELSPPGELLLARQPGTSMLLVRDGARIELAGDSDLTDYHSPLGGDVFDLCRELARHLAPGTALSLDSMPAEALKPIEEGLAAGGLFPTVTEHEVAMVVELPETEEAFYEMIGKKERHELRRKRRRYQSEVGPIEFSTERGVGFALDEFIRLHRLSEGRKGEFMTPAREAFFRRLADQPGWRLDLLSHRGRAAACLFAWVDDSTYYLYNSSYEPSYHHASPGMVALATVMEATIDEGIAYFDFLKGAESYKSRLGARPRPLYRVEATVPEGFG